MILSLTRLCAAILLSVLSVGVSHAAAADSAINALGKSFVDGVNAVDGDARLNIIRSIYSPSTLGSIGETRLDDLFIRTRDRMGELKFHHAEPTGKYLHVYAQSIKDSQWHDFQFEMSPEKPPRIKNIIFIAEVTEPVYLPNGTIDDRHTLGWLDKYIDKLATENDFGGAILLARGDKVFFERYVGYADQARSHKIGPGTRMNLGSGNKMFTALAVMQLRNQGKLSLTDTLVKFFPDYPDHEFVSHATVEQLLSHTSGLGDFFDRIDEIANDSITRLEQMLPYVYDDSIAFAPGSGFQYSNCGFIMAGLLVEKVTGEDYFDYVREHISKPLGLTNTDSYGLVYSDTTLAERLSRSASGWVRAQQGRRGSSAGGGFSTPRDMLKFARGLKAGKILNPASFREMTHPRNAAFDESFLYGYGLELSLRNKKLESFGHGGQAAGVNFEFKFFPAEDLTLVIFCNQDNGAFDDLRKNVTKLITGDR